MASGVVAHWTLVPVVRAIHAEEDRPEAYSGAAAALAVQRRSAAMAAPTGESMTGVALRNAAAEQPGNP